MSYGHFMSQSDACFRGALIQVTNPAPRGAFCHVEHIMERLWPQNYGWFIDSAFAASRTL